MICDSASVKLLRGEGSYLGVHSELDGKHCFVVPTVQQTFKQTSAEPCFF